MDPAAGIGSVLDPHGVAWARGAMSRERGARRERARGHGGGSGAGAGAGAGAEKERERNGTGRARDAGGTHEQGADRGARSRFYVIAINRPESAILVDGETAALLSAA